MDDIFEDLIGIDGNKIPDNNFDYPTAGVYANPYVQKAISQFRRLPIEEKRKKPLLYWLLGSGTPPYKMTKKGSNYIRNLKEKQITSSRESRSSFNVSSTSYGGALLRYCTEVE